MATSNARSQRGRLSAFGIRLLSATVAVGLLFSAGCSGKTPEEKLQSAVEKLNAQPPDLFGAMNILRGLAKDAKAPGEIQFMAYAQLSDIYLRHMRQPDEALEMLREAMKVQPRDTENGQNAFMAYVQMLAQLQKQEEALTEAKGYLEGPDGANLSVPRRTQLRILVASLQAATGKKEEARVALEALLSEFTDPESVKAFHGTLLEMLIATYVATADGSPGDLKGAAERYLAYAAAHPDTELSKQARFGAGVFYFQLGENEKADPLLDEYFENAKQAAAKAIDPNEKANALIALSRAYQYLGRFEEQSNVWIDALENTYADNSERYLAVLASQAIPSLVFAKKHDKARELIRKLAERFPDSKEAAHVPQVLASFEELVERVAKAEEEAAKAQADAAAQAPGEAAPEGEAPAAEATPETAPVATPAATPSSTPESGAAGE